MRRGLVALATVLIATTLPGCSSSESDVRARACAAVRELPGTTYVTLPFRLRDGGSRSEVLRVHRVLCTRLRARNVSGRITVDGRTLFVRDRLDRIGNAVSRPTSPIIGAFPLAAYDWEARVMGPGHGPQAERPRGSSIYHAVMRGQRRTRRAGGRPTRDRPVYYAVDHAARRVYFPRQRRTPDGPDREDRSAEPGSESARASLQSVPAAERPDATIVAVRPGTVIVRGMPRDGGGTSDEWFVLDDRPILQGDEIVDPRQGFDDSALAAPVVTFGLRPAGRRGWEQAVRTIMARGSRTKRPQHVAFVVDGELVSIRPLDPSQPPGGPREAQISGNLTMKEARELADLVDPDRPPALVVAR